MSFNLAHIWESMGLLGKVIAAVLLAMGIASIGVVVERLLAFSRSAKESIQFAQKATPLLRSWEVETLLTTAKAHKSSALARLFAAIVERYIGGFETVEGKITPVELARNEAERQKEQLGAELRRGMSVLASVGSVAPFVGLLGTVVGIIAAFQGIASTGSGGLGAVSAGIAEALIETAFGLMVAIPAVLFFNYLTARVNSIELALARSAGELLDEMEARYVPPSSSRDSDVGERRAA
ncbi:MAG: MotA/TolQ/ExbB proton channel family protein [Polyangiaceae bacterium]|nr:MotA/TolQ/ExbB proton channel family protein [Polyangiaceae bacterium]MCE7889926.1 MotA/TolQ/ExbB proton channel family protein [Sorangiineae bacterium PRO1]MCL4750808.1 MotA/TolQ/ExbB proton channel family protein [Myxococcales bacterium]